MSSVGVITTSYPRFAGDPAGSFVEAHVQALRALGHRIDVVAAGDGPGRVGGGGLFYAGGAPDRFEAALLASIVDGARFTARLCATIVRRARAWDSIVAHWLPSAIAAVPARKPLLAIAHGGDVHLLARLGLLAPALRLLRARDARMVFVSAALRDHALRVVPDLVADVQPMGIDVARFAAIPRTPTSPPTLFIAARLVPVKGIDVALDAFARLAAPARLVIAGAGPERAALARRARGDVSFVGEIDAAERDRWLGRASVVVVPSRITATGRTEGSPMIALEALAAGVPVVASRVGGLAALAVDHVPPDDPHALATAIEHALVTPRDPATLRQIVAHLDWRAIAPRLVRSDGHACS